MKIFETESSAIHWREDGDPGGHPVVFGNSLGTDLRLWDDILPRLDPSLRFIRFDKRGHGLSSGPDGPYTIDELTGDVAALLDDLGVRHCTFVGLSIGGMIAQNLAATRPDLVGRLVLSNTAARMGTAEMWAGRIAAIEEDGIESIADAVLERWFSDDFLTRPEVAAWRNMLARTPVKGYIGCCHALSAADLFSRTAQIRIPTLAIAGSDDGSSPPELVRDTANIIAGSRFEVIEGVGHIPCVESPETFARLVGTFIREGLDG